MKHLSKWLYLYLCIGLMALSLTIGAFPGQVIAGRSPDLVSVSLDL